MDRTEIDNVTPEMAEYVSDQIDLQDEDAEDKAEDQMQLSQEFQEAYGAPEMEEKQNQHSFLHKAAFGAEDTVRTTFLTEGELGRPLFPVRFLLDMEKMARHDNLDRIADYFAEKVKSITNSGMSNKGFSMNLNVTKRMDMNRKKFRTEDVKGGEFKK